MKLVRTLQILSILLAAFAGVSCSTAGGGRDYQPGYSGGGSSQQPASTWQDEMFRQTGY